MAHLNTVAALLVVYVCIPRRLEGFAMDPDCNITKGCFYACEDATFCEFLVAWQDAGKSVIYTLTFGSEWSEVWLAVGFSDDQQMGNDSVTGCKFFNDTTKVFNAKNRDKSTPEILSNDGVTLLTFSQVLSTMNCTFERVKEAGTDRFDLYQPWYLLFATGELTKQGELIKHSSIFEPRISDVKYNPAFPTPTPETTTAVTTTTTTTAGTTTAAGQSTTETGTTVLTTPAQVTTPQPSGPSVVKVKGCGRVTGCFSDCVGLRCSYIVSWYVDGTDAVYTVASSVARKASTWVAFAFSSDAEMGDDDVLGCVADTGRVVPLTGWNTKYDSPEIYTDNEIQLIDYTTEDGLLSCTFRRPLAPASSGNVAASQGSRRVNLSEQWTLMFAKGIGRILNNNVSIFYHNKDRSISARRVSANDLVDLGSMYRSYPLVKTHGIFMTTAWILISSVGIVIARYYKPLSGSRIFLGFSWIHAHRLFMLLVLASTIVGFVIIYVQSHGYNIYIQDKSFLQAHPVIGIVVMILAALNPAMAVFRPPPGASRRPIFNWTHRIVGVSAQILAVINIFFGVQMEKADVPYDLVYILSAYTVWQLIVTIVLENVTWFGRKFYRLEVDETGQTSSQGDEIAQDGPMALLLKEWIFVIHCTVLLSFTLSLLTLLGLGNKYLVA